MKPSRNIDRLIEIMAALRHPETGCPWDLEQNFASIAPYTIEEAYEVADAIERGDLDDLKDEVGDLLLQGVYHARLAEEAGAFSFGDAVESITAKMIRRHPHVFGDADAKTAEAVLGNWDRAKAEERERKRAARGGAAPGLLDDVPVALPGLTRAVKLQRRAGTVGFDWNDPTAVLDKIKEETAELEAELDANGGPARLEEEIGDLLFAVANLARHLKVDPERAVRSANAKFVRRFRHIEQRLTEAAIAWADADLALMERFWDEAKRAESEGEIGAGVKP